MDPGEDGILRDCQDCSYQEQYILVSDIDYLIIMFYFSFTTLTTVGFGDFHPRSSVERIFITFQMMIGVCIFSYFLGDFINII